MERRPLILGGILIVVISAIVYWHFSHSSLPAGSHASATAAASVTVTLADDGFTPETLTIHQGETVKFVSTQGSFFWPASNPHPTHTIYPEFDPQQPIAPTDSWSFTFTKIGTWHYHDHLAPYFTGTITVLPPSAAS